MTPKVAVVGHVEHVEFCVVDRLPTAGEITHATDDFALTLTKTDVERLLPKGRKIFLVERQDTLPQAFEVLLREFARQSILNNRQN